MKPCSKCGSNKSLSEFYADKSYSGGYQAWCKPCTLQRRRDRARGIPMYSVPEGYKRCNGCRKNKEYVEFYADSANKTDGRYSHCIQCKDASTKRWRKDNAAYYNQSMRDYRAKLTFDERRDIELKSAFNLPNGWYKNTLEKQNHVCAICSKPNPSIKRALAVDHHHASGKVRGVICYNCNRLLQAFDDLDLFNKIMAYLKKHEVA